MIYFNTAIPKLIEMALFRREGMLTATGAFLVYTGKYTGQSPNDKYIVETADTVQDIWWENNLKMSEKQFNSLHNKMLDYLRGKDLFIFAGYAGADPRYSLPVKVINEFAWQNIVMQQLLIRAQDTCWPVPTTPQLTVLAAPSFTANPAADGTRSETFIIINPGRKLILIGGTHYAGEIKESIFSLLNYLLPKQNILPMHCSANQAANGETALFFGLSGTGKTALSTNTDRCLIGNDEHGWSQDGIFNIEGGCYVKCTRLSRKYEPEIWDAIKFGAILENVVVDNEARRPNYDSQAITENTRAAYPMDHIPNSIYPGTGSHPSTIVFMTADAFGVLPPIARLTTEQALFYFLSGYSSRPAGTETGITEPQATFSACFGSSFFPLKPGVYANLLKEKINRHKVRVFLVNTGWQGGPYSSGTRINSNNTRLLVTAALNGFLDSAEYITEPVFKLHRPLKCPGIPDDLLNPSLFWHSQTAYRENALKLAAMFHSNACQADIPPELFAAGPGYTN
ncbi:phosphoenolpyruvate carboxykinase (ATP) [Sporomusa aerivorans]|uniref:phosphoenolpyruvate carboxykinase (ATP) n=1 Tax=Sporomusa aerivorans TaxID=204936 RepID=UPI00352BD143